MSTIVIVYLIGVPIALIISSHPRFNMNFFNSLLISIVWPIVLWFIVFSYIMEKTENPIEEAWETLKEKIWGEK